MTPKPPVPPHASPEARPHGAGYAADGPGFYVWDEDAALVTQAGRDLRVVSPRVRLASPGQD